MTLSISYLEPKRLHPHSNFITIADLANIIESKYGLLEKFTDYFGDEIIAYSLTLNLSNFRDLRILNEFIKNKWREYILRELHGIKSKAATSEQRTSFVQTKAYYQSLQVEAKIVDDDDFE